MKDAVLNVDEKLLNIAVERTPLATSGVVRCRLFDPTTSSMIGLSPLSDRKVSMTSGFIT